MQIKTNELQAVIGAYIQDRETQMREEKIHGATILMENKSTPEQEKIVVTITGERVYHV